MLIIPYQEIIGNYSAQWTVESRKSIIPYQEIIGNYSLRTDAFSLPPIIPYQEIIGNYSFWLSFHAVSLLYLRIMKKIT